MTEPHGAELLANVLLGPDPASLPLPAARGIGVRAALETAMLPALRRTPCLVSFSGGRDSSAVLAVAVAVARKHGLAPPVPAIMRFPAAPDTQETGWQELVLERLGLTPEVVELHDELDALGAIGSTALRRLGVRWPGNAYLHVPLLERARGGALMTGVGGDELLDSRASRFVRVALGRERARPRDLAAAALAATPKPVRLAVARRRERLDLPWLTRAGRDLVATAVAADAVAWPRRWDRAVSHWARSRAYAGLGDAMTALAAPYDVLAFHPLLDHAVMAELAEAGGAAGFDSRTSAMRSLFGDLLDDRVLARDTKAIFAGPLWGPATRAFTDSWSGRGVDPALVDVDALRAEWSTASPSFATILLLQRAWLAEAGGALVPH